MGGGGVATCILITLVFIYIIHQRDLFSNTNLVIYIIIIDLLQAIHITISRLKTMLLSCRFLVRSSLSFILLSFVSLSLVVFFDMSSFLVSFLLLD